jgi:hypothetical protein
MSARSTDKIPAVAAGPKTKITASFILADKGTVLPTLQSYKDDGYRLLGVSDFTNLIGQPMRNQALAYAKQIGADLVVYAVAPIGPEIHPVNHLVMDSPGAMSPPTQLRTCTETLI